MRVAVCFFGEMTFLDRFMIQNFIRCVLAPLRRRGSVDTFFFLHTYAGDGVVARLGLLGDFFALRIMTIIDKALVPHTTTTTTTEDGSLLEDYSLHRVKRLWRSAALPVVDLVLCARLDLLFSRPLHDRDVDRVLEDKNHLFTTHYPSEPLRRCFLMGDPFVVNAYTDRIHYNDARLFEETLRSHYRITTERSLSVIYVRVGADGVVLPEDRHVCPYLNDLIASSSTTIRPARRKNSNPFR